MSKDYEFEVTITAVVRVRAENESLARKGCRFLCPGVAER
jgi:hypothetical protein